MAEKTERELAQANIAGRTARHITTITSSRSGRPSVVPFGTEVKSIREGRVNLRDSCPHREGANCGSCNVNERTRIGLRRPRADATALLPLRREEIRADRQDHRKGHDAGALRLYFKNGRVKVAVGLAKGQDRHKRETIKRREVDRRRALAIKSR